MPEETAAERSQRLSRELQSKLIQFEDIERSRRFLELMAGVSLRAEAAVRSSPPGSVDSQSRDSGPSQVEMSSSQRAIPNSIRPRSRDSLASDWRRRLDPPGSGVQKLSP
ncbi:MAG: hypothetical protein QOH48_1019 [Actinomycetota bacterium]|jgi:hypothetical protein|nr:hypothetical protein [Actinomycetota bacterium]